LYNKYHMYETPKTISRQNQKKLNTTPQLYCTPKYIGSM
jgi:hypothetical protein